jgi:hypothetical protein
MRYAISGGSGRTGPVLLLLVVSLLIMVFPLMLSASESCSMMGGNCRDACGKNEQAEPGAFEDCGPKQECCIAGTATPVQCCITSFDAHDFGPSNCRAPEGGACPKGSASPAPCGNLPMCTKK